jgi:saccharopine dehydrogenase-like NADP-dependent oxidoreductase
MKSILIFGAGKSSSYLIAYLLEHAASNNWMVTVVDKYIDHLVSRYPNHPNLATSTIDINNSDERNLLIVASDIVISLLPPDLHIIIATSCIEGGKSLITASYVSEEIKKLNNKAIQNNVMLMCEMGLDPGIDHMSAMHIIDKLEVEGAAIESFKSHCGGLVAPNSDTNPWHYKISWNPKNVVMAGKAGAHYFLNNEEVHVAYENMFKNSPQIQVGSLPHLAYYPNRDSLSYRNIYELKSLHTLIRTTLRYPSYNKAWQFIVDFDLTNEDDIYETSTLTYQQWLCVRLGTDNLDAFLKNACGEDTESLQLLRFLLINDNEVLINIGKVSSATILQKILEAKWMMQPEDKDMIVMQHEFVYVLANKHYYLSSSLIVEGKDRTFTAMAKTVGLPMAILAKEILLGNIPIQPGVQIPVKPVIYNPILSELASHGIVFEDKVKEIIS